MFISSKPAKCDACGETHELRPYGPPHAKNICHPCSQLPEYQDVCKANFIKILDEEDDLHIENNPIVNDMHHLGLLKKGGPKCTQ